MTDHQVERKRTYALHHGRSRKPIVRIVRDERSPLYRIAWPDIGLSTTANLARCMDAAIAWAEGSFVADHRKMSGARRLKSLNNFSWASSPVAQTSAVVISTPKQAVEAVP